ncbi:DUF7352 domain-containing protein [Streptomyces phytophilus]|uniref:DUF7352 domain-containing protein n=1 Tax=Streptomyces phytophilus TaxID=722715 RepID=UPI0015F0E91F|nr:hypothetical protein [Streptomyces phytophilus]
MPRRMLRHWLLVNDKPTRIETGGPVVRAAAGRLGIGPNAQHIVEFWAEGSLETDGTVRTFQVLGTGHALPDGAQWRGTTARTPEGLVWHLYELPTA